MLEGMTKFSLNRPKTVIVAALLLTMLFSLAFLKIKIDTDPENMLEPHQPDRVFYDQMKRDFGIHDLIVLGIVDDRGIFRRKSLERIGSITEKILRIKGVIIEDVLSLTTTDNVKSSGRLIDIHPIMREVPRSKEEIELLRKDILENPFLDEKLASRDGTAIALYIPIQKKDMSYRIAGEIEKILKRELLAGQRYHLAGLPVAEDTFGHEMFIQMVVVAPLAFCVILILVFLLFRHMAFLLPVGMDAMFAVIWAMGLLIATGNTVHIMSSMIPVFLMPIAILDDIHVLSGFFDSYREVGDKRQALLKGMKPLYRPMLYTSITSAVGFASLSLVNIPPVRVFGLFVAFGIMAAWLFSMMLVPAVISLMSDEKLKKSLPLENQNSSSRLDGFIKWAGRFSHSRARLVILFSLIIIGVGIFGILQIDINDNPVKWFKKSHPTREANRVMNKLFGGTYMAYLVLDGKGEDSIKNPEVIRYIDRLQKHLESNPIIGKTSSIADIIKRIGLVLHNGEISHHSIPNTKEAIGQFLFLYQSSGDPNDLDNFLDKQARRANIWVQMKGGDNLQMKEVEENLAEFTAKNPPPFEIELRLSGLTYINKVWQNLMVAGMLSAILGSAAVVLLLMILEFRSIFMGLLSMIPLSLSILLSYGLVGLVGKDYDMPIAVCSSLALGLAIDFAIHFLQRFKEKYAEVGNLEETSLYMSGDPCRAILRNALVIAIGFLPLTVSTLTPYVTVGVFFFLLMIFSFIATLFVLPAALKYIGPWILKGGER